MIRAAELSDLPYIVAAGADFVRTGTYGVEVADEAHLASVVENALSDPAGVIAVLREGGGFGGCYMGGVVKNFITGQDMLFEIFLWVDPALQGLGHGRSLIEFAEAMARAKGAKSSMISHPASSAAGRNFERWGYALTELHYRKAL